MSINSRKPDDQEGGGASVTELPQSDTMLVFCAWCRGRVDVGSLRPDIEAPSGGASQ